MTKKQLVLGLAAAALLSGSVSAAGFAKVNTYTEGQFADVPAAEWYASSVAASYELGFMKGSSDTTFEPEGNITVAEAITIADRVYDIYNAKNADFTAAGSNWYDVYVDFAKANGIITADQFADYDKPATRAEMITIFSKSVPASFLNKINDVKEIADVPSTNAYFEDLLMLYNAGVVLGNDAYGTFLPNNNITRAEAAAIINRIALPESRIQKQIVDANYGDAFYLINEAGTTFTSGKSVYDTPWQVDNRNLLGVVTNGASSISDYYPDGKVEMWRDIDDVTEGLIGMDYYGSITVTDNGDEGAYLKFTDDKVADVINLHTKDNKWYFNNTDTGIAFVGGGQYINLRADNDKGTAELYINGEKAPNALTFKAGTIARFYIGSGEKTLATLSIARLDVFKDYLVNDLFFTGKTEDGVRAWDITGKASVIAKGGTYGNDAQSVSLEKGSAKKTFNPVSGSVVFESYMLAENGNAGTVELKSGDTTVAKLVVNADGVFNGAGEKLRFHNGNIWQTLRIEADTVKNTVKYVVNGKAVGEGAFDAAAETVDNIVISTEGAILFDDVQVYLTHEYDDYCPVPKPITDDGYDVILNICSLWREGFHYGWGAESAYPDVEPALGYYDEGIVETADWEIKFWVENGIDVAHFCWYCGQSDTNTPIKKSSHNNALHDGFFNAKYSDMMKFTFMWENTGVNAYNLDQFKEYIWSYWMDYYFLDPRFYTIDNELVFTVWSVDNFKKAFGGTYEGCEEAVKFMNEDAKAHGFNGVKIFFADGHNVANQKFNEFAKVGGSGAYAYHWNQDGNNYNNTVTRLQKNVDYGAIHIVPTVSVGFNNIGWSNVRKNLITVADHKKVIEYIKNNVLAKESGWEGKTMIVSTWNEYGEGTYVMPCPDHVGFGYLENVAEVISGVTDHSTNIFPTEQQKARLGHLYPKSKTSIFSLDYEDKKEDSGVPSKVLQSLDGTAFKPSNVNEGFMEGEVITASGKNSDPILSLVDGSMEPFEAKDVVAFRLTFNCEVDSVFEIFFTTKDDPSWTQNKSGAFKYSATDDLQTMVFYTDKMTGWDGTIEKIRLDVCSKQDAKFSFAKVEMLGYDDSQFPYVLNYDGKDFEPAYDVEMRGDECYVPADAYAGFFSLNNFYYEWSRKTGVLRILTKKNHEFIFTVGSQTAMVDGKEVKLAEQFQTKDGLPLVPLFMIYKLEGTQYKIEGKKINVQLIDPKYLETINNRVAYQYEFDVPGDIEGFSGAFCSIAVVNGYLSGDAIARDNQSPRYDPMFTLSGIKINALECNKIVVGMKYKLEDGVEKSGLEIFFKRTTDSGLAQARSARAALEGNSTNDIVEYTVDFSENKDWNGFIDQIRVDPMSCGGHFDIDYIRFVIDEETRKKNEEAIEAARKAEEERLAKGLLIVNGDAEEKDTAGSFFGNNGNATLSIIEDRTDKNNHVWLCTPAEGKVWAYSRHKVTWIPGMTYKISFDIRLAEGYEAGSGKCNLQFADPDKKGKAVAGSDPNSHFATSIDGLTSSTEWKHYECEYTIPEECTDRGIDAFTIYFDPREDGSSVGYEFDNVTISKAE